LAATGSWAALELEEACRRAKATIFDLDCYPSVDRLRVEAADQMQVRDDDVSRLKAVPRRSPFILAEADRDGAEALLQDLRNLHRLEISGRNAARISNGPTVTGLHRHLLLAQRKPEILLALNLHAAEAMSTGRIAPPRPIDKSGLR
jgi:hypothetical protein